MVQREMDLSATRLGECRVPSPMCGVQFVGEAEHVLYHWSLEQLQEYLRGGLQPPFFEAAGPRDKIYFDPSKLKCGIVTCGGICPGLNDVIRAIVLSLNFHYGVKTVFGFRYGYEGLTSRNGHSPLQLTPQLVNDIHHNGGTILGSSRGPQDVTEMVDTLERMSIGILFTVGGDGTLRGAAAISEEITRRNLKIAVIGIPKTIDNDISFVQTSFGFETAVSEATKVIYAANSEAEGAWNGIGLVKLMGRESGFIACFATLATSVVNYCLIPEVSFSLDAFLEHLRQRLERRRHAVIVVGEGAGQDLMQSTGKKDASGNVRLGDIGLFLKEKITDHFKNIRMEATLKYLDPSYAIRGMPANPHDSVFCLLLGYNAVHAGMAGRTNMVVGFWNHRFTHVPIRLAVSERKHVYPRGTLWSNVVSATGQPVEMC